MYFLFDLDGTLIDSTPAILEAMAHALASEGLDASEEFIKRQIGAPLAVMMREFGCTSEAQMYRLLAAYKAHYAGIYAQKTALLPGAREAVALAAANGCAAVVTTKTGEFARAICAQLGLYEAGLRALVGGDEVCGQTKPAPAPIYAAASDLAAGRDSAAVEFAPEAAVRAAAKAPWWPEPSELAAPLGRCVMIGDTLNDTLAARAAGVRALVSEFIYTPASEFSGEVVLKSPLECVEYAIKNFK